MRIVVDLPAPLGPRKPVTRPGLATNDTSSTATWPPYVFDTPSTVIMQRVSAGEGSSDIYRRAGSTRIQRRGSWSPEGSAQEDLGSVW